MCMANLDDPSAVALMAQNGMRTHPCWDCPGLLEGVHAAFSCSRLAAMLHALGKGLGSCCSVWQQLKTCWRAGPVCKGGGRP